MGWSWGPRLQVRSSGSACTLTAQHQGRFVPLVPCFLCLRTLILPQNPCENSPFGSSKSSMPFASPTQRKTRLWLYLLSFWCVPEADHHLARKASNLEVGVLEEELLENLPSRRSKNAGAPGPCQTATVFVALPPSTHTLSAEIPSFL